MGSLYPCVCVRVCVYPSVHTGHRAPGHAVGHVSVLVDVVVQQILEAAVTELKELVRVCRSAWVRRRGAAFRWGRGWGGAWVGVATRDTGD